MESRAKFICLCGLALLGASTGFSETNTSTSMRIDGKEYNAVPVESTVVLSASSKDTFKVSQDPNRPWVLKDPVCIVRTKGESVCGEVILSTPELATVKILPGMAQQKKTKNSKKKKPEALVPKAGEKVYIATLATPPPAVAPPVESKTYHIGVVNVYKVDPNGKKTLQREVASNNGANTESVVTPPSFRHSISIGMIWGFDYFIPNVNYQYALRPNIAIGGKFLFSSATSKAKTTTVGLFVTGDYFFTNTIFNDFFAEIGLGSYYLDSRTTLRVESAFLPSAIFGLGWKASVRANWQIGLLAGGQYVSQSSRLKFVNFSNFYPLFSAEVAYRF